MKKILFISNISNRITNFSIPSIIAGQSLGYEFHMAANYSKFNDDSSKYNVKIHHIDLDRNPFSLRNFRAYKQMMTLIQQEGYEVIHCNTPIGSILGRICGKIAKVPKIIYTVHGFHFFEGAPLVNRTIFKWVEKWLARYTDAIITINKEDYQAAHKFKLRGGGSVYYMPGVGVDTTSIRNVYDKRKNVLEEIHAKDDNLLMISVGELNSNKNNSVIIEAMKKLNNSKLHYLLCGVGEQETVLKGKVIEYGLENNVHFLGYRDDVPQLLKSSDLFVLPSYREGLSRSLMEAMSAGLPCIVSKIRGNVDLIKDGRGGFLHEPYDVDELASSLKRLIENPKLRTDMGKFNIEKVKEFDIENVKKEIYKIYCDVLKPETISEGVF